MLYMRGSIYSHKKIAKDLLLARGRPIRISEVRNIRAYRNTDADVVKKTIRMLPTAKRSNRA